MTIVRPFTTTAGPAPGSIFKGNTIQLPCKYLDMKSREMTLQMLHDTGCKEWFETRVEGRRRGEVKEYVFTLHNPVEKIAVEGRLPYHNVEGELDMEAVKGALRKQMANKK